MKKFIILLLFSTPFAAETISWEINQTKVFFVQNKEIPMIDIAIAFHAGSRYAKPVIQKRIPLLRLIFFFI